MDAVIKSFRSQTFGDVYQFRFVNAGAYWEVFIESHPPNPRGGSANDTHILSGNKLCISSGYEPKTLEQAISRSWTWIHYFSTYIRSGSTEQKLLRANLPDYDDDGNRS